MIKNLLLFLLFTLSLIACQPNPIISTTKCSDPPRNSLKANDIKSVPLNAREVKENGIVKSDSALGYSFNAKSGQQFRYQTSNNICVWVYDPNSQLLTSQKLPRDGRYIVQISAMNGQESFNIFMQLSNIFESEKFPKAVCGDPLPEDAKSYPLNFYPVLIDYSERNLRIVKSQFCQDALPITRTKAGMPTIQVASFISSDKAMAFREFMISKIGSGEVSEPTKIDQKRSKVETGTPLAINWK